jgi:hypothetical protein
MRYVVINLHHTRRFDNLGGMDYNCHSGHAVWPGISRRFEMRYTVYVNGAEYDSFNQKKYAEQCYQEQTMLTGVDTAALYDNENNETIEFYIDPVCSVFETSQSNIYCRDCIQLIADPECWALDPRLGEYQVPPFARCGRCGLILNTPYPVDIQDASERFFDRILSGNRPHEDDQFMINELFNEQNIPLYDPADLLAGIERALRKRNLIW